MDMTKDQAKGVLHDAGLRVTSPRLAVMMVLAEAERPLAHSEVLEVLGETDFDPATVYRNLVKLKEAGIAVVASQAGGIDRYVLATAEDGGHRHPHFVCEDCGLIACLPDELTLGLSIEGPWAASVKGATVQLKGECPDCIER
jgi:Fur family ferric uptake transcriptional regulator